MCQRARRARSRLRAFPVTSRARRRQLFRRRKAPGPCFAIATFDQGNYHVGVDRKTFDFDFHRSSEEAQNLEVGLARTRLFSRTQLKEAVRLAYQRAAKAADRADKEDQRTDR